MKSKVAIFGAVLLSLILTGCSTPLDRTDTLTELDFAESYGESLLLVQKTGIDSSAYEKAHRELSVAYENADSMGDEDFLKNSEKVLDAEAESRNTYVTAIVDQIEKEKAASDTEIAQKEADGWTQMSPTTCTEETTENLKERAMSSLNPHELLSVSCIPVGWVKQSEDSAEDRF